MDLDPLSPIIRCELGGIYVRTGHYDEAVDFMKKTIALDPSFARAHQTLASVYNTRFEIPGAIDEYEIEDSLLQRRTPLERATWFGSLREAYHRGGRVGYFRRLLALRQERSRKSPTPALSMALPHAMLGDLDSAFYWLEKAKEQHDPNVLRTNVEEQWAPLYQDPRYARYVRSLGQKEHG
jgi:uncharacterized protein HemY